jgi:hypothetical protein
VPLVFSLKMRSIGMVYSVSKSLLIPR